jgi:tetratricopeptide (TPR) repeat protein
MSIGADARTLSAVAELGYWLMRAGQLRDARRLWEGVAADAGHLEAPWRALAVIALREGRFDDGVAAANIACQRRPDSPAPLVLRAEALRAQGRYEEAHRDLQAALALPPRSSDDALVQARARAMAGMIR